MFINKQVNIYIEGEAACTQVYIAEIHCTNGRLNEWREQFSINIDTSETVLYNNASIIKHINMHVAHKIMLKSLRYNNKKRKRKGKMRSSFILVVFTANKIYVHMLHLNINIAMLSVTCVHFCGPLRV